MREEKEKGGRKRLKGGGRHRGKHENKNGKGRAIEY